MPVTLRLCIDLLTIGGVNDLRVAVAQAPAACALALVAAVMVAGTQATLLVAGPRPSWRRSMRAAAVGGLLPLAVAAPVAAALLAAASLVSLPKRRAANDNLPVALGLGE